MSNQSPEDFMKGLLSAAPVEGLDKDPTVTYAEIQAMLGEEMPKIMKLSPDEICMVNPIAGPTVIGLVMAHAIVKKYGTEALKTFVEKLGSSLINKKEL